MTPARRVCLIVGPWRTATEKEKEHLNRALMHLVALDWCPVFLPYVLMHALDDERPAEREAAIECSRSFVMTLARDLTTECFVLGDRVTEGMGVDIATWRAARGETLEAFNTVVSGFGSRRRLDVEPRGLVWSEADRARVAS